MVVNVVMREGIFMEVSDELKKEVQALVLNKEKKATKEDIYKILENYNITDLNEQIKELEKIIGGTQYHTPNYSLLSPDLIRERKVSTILRGTIFKLDDMFAPYKERSS